MLSRIPASTFWEWLAYSELEPFGEDRGDLRAGIIASTIAEVNRNRKKRSRPYTAKEFMPKFDKPRRQNWRDQLKIVEALNRAFGGDDLRQNKGEKVN